MKFFFVLCGLLLLASCQTPTETKTDIPMSLYTDSVARPSADPKPRSAQSDRAAFAWEGDYSHESDYGQNAAGTGMVVGELLSVMAVPDQPNHYTFLYTANGYQTFYTLAGHAQANGNELVGYFDKVTEGTFYQKDQLQKDQPFFKLRQADGQWQTQWMQASPETDAQKGTLRTYFTPQKRR